MFRIAAAWRAAVLLASAVVATASAGSAAPVKYRTSGLCDGFPRLPVTTAPGLCLGLVASDLGFPRGVVAIGDDIYVLDMGGWHPHRGRLLKLPTRGHGAPVVQLDKLDEPSALVATPAGLLYVGTLGAILSVDPRAPEPKSSVRTIVGGLPSDGRHPLPALALAADGTLYIGMGSATDHCETADGKPPDPAKPCPEEAAAIPRGAIYSVTPGAEPVALGQTRIVARGVRNAQALAVLASGTLVAGVNARDYIDLADPKLSDEELPHDTLDWIEPGADYGWPYCYDDNRASPEYPGFDCGTKRPPTRLLPPHAAPLGALRYVGNALPPLAGRLIIGYHGYRRLGHRLVALALDSAGKPQGEPVDLVSGLDKIPGTAPQGAPVALAEMSDGSVLVTEDLNGTLLRLARSTGG
jgi:glucose/arabinose dehydrogenase